MSEPGKIVVLSPEELKALIHEAVAEALKGQNGSGEIMLNAEQAAEYLNYSRDWIYRNWRKLGGVKVGKRGVRFSRLALEEWTVLRKG